MPPPTAAAKRAPSPRKSAAGLALFSLPFLLIGVWIMLVAVGKAPSGRVNAPAWVVFTAGIVFLAPGLFMFLAALRGVVAASPRAPSRSPPKAPSRTT